MKYLNETNTMRFDERLRRDSIKISGFRFNNEDVINSRTLAKWFKFPLGTVKTLARSGKIPSLTPKSSDPQFLVGTVRDWLSNLSESENFFVEWDVLEGTLVSHERDVFS